MGDTRKFPASMGDFLSKTEQKSRCVSWTARATWGTGVLRHDDTPRKYVL